MSKLLCSTCGLHAVGTNRNAPEWGWPYRCFYCEPWGSQEGDTGPKPAVARYADQQRALEAREAEYKLLPWLKRLTVRLRLATFE